MEDYKKLFIRFCRLEVASGGPDPQMPVLAGLCAKSTLQERYLLSGLYAMIYDVTSAEYVWRLMLDTSYKPAKLIDQVWDKIVIRNERRCVRTREKMTRCLAGYLQWMNGFKPATVGNDYMAMWEQVTSVPYIGRYSAIKLIHTLRHTTGLPVLDPDIRPKDAWSPRYSLSLIYPEHKKIMLDKSAPIAEVNAIAAKALHLLQRKVDGKLTYYELQTMLCQFRECLKGNRFYPGRSHDEILDYYNRMKRKRSGFSSQLFSVRAKLFPSAHLGEFNGWRGIRKELENTYKDYGYFWSDLKFDYKLTKEFAVPILKEKQ